MPQRILVVDDEPEIVRVLRGYLERSGFEVLTAYDGVRRCAARGTSRLIWWCST